MSLNKYDNMKVFIHSIPKVTSAIGLNNLRDPDTGKSLKKSKLTSTTRDRLVALYSGKTGGLATGLTEPWLDDNGVQKKDVSGRPLTLQDKEEERWNLEKGFLTNRPWRKGDSPKESDLTYFQKQYWKLNDGLTVLDLNNFDQAMFYYVALASKLVANSEKELRENKWPFALYYIALANESDELIYAKNKSKIEAMGLLSDRTLTDIWKKKIIYILELSSVFTSLTDEQATNILYTFIDKDDTGKNISRFTNLVKMLKKDTSRKRLNAMLLLRKAIESRVIYNKSDTYTWARSAGEIILGERYEDAIEFILSKTKESLVEELVDEIKAKLI